MALFKPKWASPNAEMNSLGCRTCEMPDLRECPLTTGGEGLTNPWGGSLNSNTLLWGDHQIPDTHYWGDHQIKFQGI